MATLSRGYRQRVGVAQAILHRPGVLILDEPTNGLDPTQVRHMRGLIRDLARDATVILSTHILQEVQAVCDRVIIIRDGRKAVDAALEALSASNRLRVALDAAPDTAVGALAAVPGVARTESLPVEGAGEHHYLLHLSDGVEMGPTADRVARLAVDRGWRIYRLQPERRDLEALFGEITAEGEVP